MVTRGRRSTRMPFKGHVPFGGKTKVFVRARTPDTILPSPSVFFFLQQESVPVVGPRSSERKEIERRQKQFERAPRRSALRAFRASRVSVATRRRTLVLLVGSILTTCSEGSDAAFALLPSLRSLHLSGWGQQFTRSPSSVTRVKPEHVGRRQQRSRWCDGAAGCRVGGRCFFCSYQTRICCAWN